MATVANPFDAVHIETTRDLARHAAGYVLSEVGGLDVAHILEAQLNGVIHVDMHADEMEMCALGLTEFNTYLYIFREGWGDRYATIAKQFATLAKRKQTVEVRIYRIDNAYVLAPLTTQEVLQRERLTSQSLIVRAPQRNVVIMGYQNAGKSYLANALLKKQVYEMNTMKWPKCEADTPLPKSYACKISQSVGSIRVLDMPGFDITRQQDAKKIRDYFGRIRTVFPEGVGVVFLVYDRLLQDTTKWLRVARDVFDDALPESLWLVNNKYAHAHNAKVCAEYNASVVKALQVDFADTHGDLSAEHVITLPSIYKNDDAEGIEDLAKITNTLRSIVINNVYACNVRENVLYTP